jgi:uncharacterized membrane protein YfcA
VPHLSAALIFSSGAAAMTFLVVSGHPVWAGVALAVAAVLAALIGAGSREADPAPREAAD